MSTELIAPPADVSDADLLRHWLDEIDPGETFITIYGRFRQEVRESLEAMGLQPIAAEDRVGAVFARVEATRRDLPPETPLRDRLLAAVRGLAADVHNDAAERRSEDDKNSGNRGHTLPRTAPAGR